MLEASVTKIRESFKTTTRQPILVGSNLSEVEQNSVISGFGQVSVLSNFFFDTDVGAN